MRIGDLAQAGMHMLERLGRRLNAMLAPDHHRHCADFALGDPAQVVLVVPGSDARRLAQLAGSCVGFGHVSIVRHLLSDSAICLRCCLVAYETILVECAERVGLVTLNRPERRNAYTARMGAELGEAFAALEADDDIRAIVVTGAGKYFCAGADLGGGGNTFNRLSDDESRARDRDRAAQAPRPWEMRTPIIGAINGSAVGIGITLPMQWDIRIVAREARLGFIFNRRGVTPEANSTWIVPRLIGLSRAMELMLTGRMFSGAEAVEMGLASQAVDAEQVLATAMALAHDIADNVAPVSAAITKQLLYRFLSEPDRNAAHELEARAFSWAGQQADAREGVASFLEKRAPDWKLSKHADLSYE
jgi:enoyl-CoA hydratase/carnithine racemase